MRTEATAAFAQWQPLVTFWHCVALPQGLCTAMLTVAPYPRGRLSSDAYQLYIRTNGLPYPDLQSVDLADRGAPFF